MTTKQVPYVGVTGFMDPAEVNAARAAWASAWSAIGKEPSHRLMIGDIPLTECAASVDVRRDLVTIEVEFADADRIPWAARHGQLCHQAAVGDVVHVKHPATDTHKITTVRLTEVTGLHRRGAISSFTIRGVRYAEKDTTASPPDWKDAIARIKMAVDVDEAIRRELNQASASRAKCAALTVKDLYDRLGGDGTTAALNHATAPDMITAIREHANWCEVHARDGVTVAIVDRLEMARRMVDAGDTDRSFAVLGDVLDSLKRISPAVFADRAEQATKDAARKAKQTTTPGRTAGKLPLTKPAPVTLDYDATARNILGMAAHDACPLQTTKWEHLHEAVREAYRVQGEAVVRRAFKLANDRHGVAVEPEATAAGVMINLTSTGPRSRPRGTWPSSSLRCTSSGGSPHTSDHPLQDHIEASMSVEEMVAKIQQLVPSWRGDFMSTGAGERIFQASCMMHGQRYEMTHLVKAEVGDDATRENVVRACYRQLCG